MTGGQHLEAHRDRVIHTFSVVWLQSQITTLPFILVMFGLIGWEPKVGLRPAIHDVILDVLPREIRTRSDLVVALSAVRAFLILPAAGIMVFIEGWRNDTWKCKMLTRYATHIIFFYLSS